MPFHNSSHTSRCMKHIWVCTPNLSHSACYSTESNTYLHRICSMKSQTRHFGCLATYITNEWINNCSLNHLSLLKTLLFSWEELEDNLVTAGNNRFEYFPTLFNPGVFWVTLKLPFFKVTLLSLFLLSDGMVSESKNRVSFTVCVFFVVVVVLRSLVKRSNMKTVNDLLKSPRGSDIVR